MSTPKPFPRALVLGCLVMIPVVAFAGYTYVTHGSQAAAPAAVASQQPAPKGGKVAAVVNGQEIFDSELAGAVAQGVDRAVAIDRYVNKALAADLARSAYGKEATEALRGAEREVLSQLYIAKKTESLRAGVTDAEVKSYYDANVKVEDYAGYKVRFAMTADEKEAVGIAEAIAGGKVKDVEARFKPVKDGADGFLMAAELPYGLGGVVRALKKGEYSRPIVLRNGFFILYLEDTKANPKPEQAKVAEEIKNLLVAKKLTDELVAARAAAKVELR